MVSYERAMVEKSHFELYFFVKHFRLLAPELPSGTNRVHDKSYI